MASIEEADNGLEERPLNLLNKILKKIQQLPVTQEEIEVKSENIQDGTDIQEEEPLLDVDDPGTIVDKICASEGTLSIDSKLKLLTHLSEICKGNPRIYAIVGSSPLVYFAEKLFSNYSKAVNIHSGIRYVTGKDLAEFVLIIPVLQLLAQSVNMSIQKIRTMFLYESEVLLQLMQAAVQCSYSIDVTFKNIQKSVLKKKLTGALFNMEQQQIKKLLTNYVGFQVPSAELKLDGYHVTLYEVNDKGELNINEDIIKKQPLNGGKYTCTQIEPDPILDCCEEVESAELRDIAVARVTFQKTLFVYTEKDWQDCLANISTCIKEIILQMDISAEQDHHVGTVYGFWSSDVEFERESPVMVPCLRGQVWSLTENWAMLWVMDLGLLGFIPKAKLYPLPHEIADGPWLISVCLLRGPIFNLDEVFFKEAYKLLSIILETNAQTGKHMLFYETGKHILDLIEYPETSVRIAVFKLLLCLAKNCKDVVNFFMKQQFDNALIGKLERYAHAYTACLFASKEDMEVEIEKMLMILLLTLKQREDFGNWAEYRRTCRVLWMYKDNTFQWKKLVQDCLIVLTRRSTYRPQENSRNYQQFRPRFNRNSNFRENTQLKNGSHDLNGMQADDLDKGGVRSQSNANMQENRRFRTNQVNKWDRDNLNCQRAGEQRRRWDQGNSRDYDYRRNENNSGYRGYNSYNPRRQTPRRYEGTSQFQKPGSFEEGQGDNIEESSNHTQYSRRWENEDAPLMMKREETYEDYQSPHRPRLPKLNTLRRPTYMYNRVPATYHSLLEPCDDLPSVDDEKPVKEASPVNLEAEVDYVIYGSEANIKWDKTHEIILGNKLWDMKEVDLAQKLCGLLNNNIEGSIYFGLTQDSIIEGIWIGRDDKDTFRNGIDRIMNRCLLPEVRGNCYDIIFTPVLRSDDKLTDLAKQSLFIVEIRVRPLVHMVYMVYQNRKCYKRQGSETVECTVAEKKQDMMDEEERKVDECIQLLEAAANNDVGTLAKLVKDKLIEDKLIPDTES